MMVDINCLILLFLLAISSELTRRYEARLAQQDIMANQHPHYHKWLRYYLDFCHKYSFAPADRRSLPAFQENPKQRPAMGGDGRC